jgi:hypothetical protein
MPKRDRLPSVAIGSDVVVDAIDFPLNPFVHLPAFVCGARSTH